MLSSMHSANASDVIQVALYRIAPFLPTIYCKVYA